ncbi:hypothetical protein [Sphingobacterium spiritivorum]|uniref:hypothetical protein n=1 Tax=Sphingobacterium spiritivorum TaxID=258 RepID=UPI003DA5CE42
MKNIDNFLKIAEHYYSSAILYDDTSEHLRLLDKISEARYDKKLQAVLLKSITNIFKSPQFETEYYTRYSMLDRSHLFRVENLLLSNKERICDIIIGVSFLAPYFCIYQRETIIDFDENGNRGYQSYNLNLDEFSFVKMESILKVRTLLENMGYSEIKGNQIVTPMPYFYMCGIPKEEFTLFNVLFKDSLEV